MNQQEQLLNETTLQLDAIQKEKHEYEQQLQTNQQTIEELQTTNSQLHTELDQKVTTTKRQF